MDENRHSFLTQTDRAILNGEYEGTDESERAARYRLRKKARQALTDLTTIAQSEEIDHADGVLEPDALATLLRTCLYPDHTHHFGDNEEVTGGLIGYSEYTNEFQHYTDRLRLQLHRVANEAAGPDQEEQSEESF